MKGADRIAALTVGSVDELCAAVEELLANPARAESAEITLAGQRLSRVGFELDDPRELARVRALRQRFAEVFG